MLCGGPWMFSATATDATATDATEPDATFFESKIRPALIEHCLECHATDTEASGGLLLDSRQGWAKGGDLGPAIKPGDVDASLLMRAIRYDDPDLEMPPEGKLPDAVIANFETWIKQGAIDPRRQASDEGNPEPASESVAEKAAEHWSYQSPVIDDKLVKRNDLIDHLLDREIKSQQLTKASPASPAVLIRRLAFDLQGLPPDPSDVKQFANEASPQAYEALVDRFLDSPQFGEHFARHWMDVARYADSITLRGFVLNDAWRYRDYLVTAYNQDRPFDQMIRDQIAGDLLATGELEEDRLRAIATGFLAMGNSNLEDQDKTKLEFDHLDEQLETIGRAFMGQTIGCARCHDHKFDPITADDYYALAGIFRSTVPMAHANLSKWISAPLPISAEQQQRYDQVKDELRVVSAQIKSLKAQQKGAPANKNVIALDTLPGIVIDDEQATYVGDWTQSTATKPYVGKGYHHDANTNQGNKSATFEPKAIKTGRYEVRMAYTHGTNRATQTIVKVFSANESKTVRVNQRAAGPIDGIWISLGEYPFEAGGQAFVMVSNEDADGHVIVDAIQFLPVEQPDQELANADADKERESEEQREEQARLAKQINELVAKEKLLKAEVADRPTYLSISEGEPKQEVAIRVRGNPHQFGAKVPRGFIAAVGRAEYFAKQIPQDRSGRVELANWIADPQNPLTARVYVNRVWSWLIGEGLVPTENQFGTTGTAPTHPELLDHLTQQFINQGWSTKQLVKQIVTSDAYQRSSRRDQSSQRRDPENRFYSAANVKRLPVESLRDAMMQASGRLQMTMGGSLIPRGLSSDYNFKHKGYRRSLYQPVFRNSLPPLFQAFDFADPSVSVGDRNQSTVATQALEIMNHPWVIECAAETAKRVLEEKQWPGTAELVDRLYWLCLARQPSKQEMESCLQFLTEKETSGSLDPQRVQDLVQALFVSIDFRYLE